MARYELRFKPSVAKDLRNVPKQEVQRIMNCIEALGDAFMQPGSVLGFERQQDGVGLFGCNRCFISLGMEC